jgi:uncharacterized Fe-S cluster-containing radical SAM superfamily protein
MMTLEFKKANGKTKLVKISGDQATISKGHVMDGDMVIALCLSEGFILANGLGGKRGGFKAKLYDTLNITMGDEG